MSENEIVYAPAEVDNIQEFEDFLQIAERRSSLFEKIKVQALKATNNSDWVDQGGKPYMEGSGAEKVRIRFGLKVWDMTQIPQKEFRNDQHGDYYFYVVRGKVGFNQHEYIETMGTCTSRQQLFAKRGDKYLPMNDVDETNILKSAYTNFLVNGITRFLGLRNMTWEELKEYGVDHEKVAKIEYASGKKSAKWSEDQDKKARRIGDFLLANADGDKAKAGENLKEFTTWTDKNGKVVEGKTTMKSLSGKQVDMLFNKLKKDIVAFEAGGGDVPDDLPEGME